MPVQCNRCTFAHMCTLHIWQVEQKPGGRGRGREWATLGVHPLSWLLSNNRLEKVPFVSVPYTSSNRLLLSNQDKGCTPSVAHSLALPLGPALLNLWIVCVLQGAHVSISGIDAMQASAPRDRKNVRLWYFVLFCIFAINCVVLNFPKSCFSIPSFAKIHKIIRKTCLYNPELLIYLYQLLLS